jgi:hypothetical protein
VWERLQYDWSDPNHVVLNDADSNAWGGNSGHTYTVHAERRRDDQPSTTWWCARARTSKGKFLGIVLGSIGKSRLVKAFENSVKAVEARNNPAPASQP